MEQPYVPPIRHGYNLALASLIVGIVVLLIGCCIPFSGIPLGLVAVVLGVMALKSIRPEEDQPDSTRTMAIVGIVLGSLAILFGIAGGLWFSLVFGRMFRGYTGSPFQPNMPGPFR